MSGAFSLTLPVMLAVAIASTVSRALSYGTIYTTKLLRRGTDIDQALPWRALQDLKITDVMRPFRPALPVPPVAAAPDGNPADSGPADGDGAAPDQAAAAGPVTYRHDPQALFDSESLSQALRQLEVYGRDGLPVLSPDGNHVGGSGTGGRGGPPPPRPARQTRPPPPQAPPAADPERGDTEAMLAHPPVPLPGYQV